MSAVLILSTLCLCSSAAFVMIFIMFCNSVLRMTRKEEHLEEENTSLQATVFELRRKVKELEDTKPLDRKALSEKFCELACIPVGTAGAWQEVDSSIIWNWGKARYYKVKEEFEELRDALYARNLREFVDALTDICYAIEVTYHAIGVDSDKAFMAVHESNMTKEFDPNSQSVVKGEAFKLPDFNAAMGVDMDDDS